MCHAVGVTNRAGLDTYRDLTIRPTTETPMGTSLRNRLCTFQAFSALYQVKQVPKSRETRFKLVFFFGTDGRGPRLDA